MRWEREEKKKKKRDTRGGCACVCDRLDFRTQERGGGRAYTCHPCLSLPRPTKQIKHKREASPPLLLLLSFRP
jgi:hypothetical protein